MYFSEHKLATEVVEKGHTNRDKKKENEREEKIIKKLGCKLIRINPHVENYNIFVEIGKTEGYIAQSNKEAEKKEIKEKLEKEKEAEIKEIKAKLEKEKEAEIKEIKAKLEKEKEAEIEELNNKNKKIKTKIKNLTTS